MQGVKSAVNGEALGSLQQLCSDSFPAGPWVLFQIGDGSACFWLKTFSEGKGEHSDYRLLRQLLSRGNICSCQKWLSVLLGIQTFLTDPPLSLVNKFKSDSGKCLCVRLSCAQDLCPHFTLIDPHRAIPDHVNLLPRPGH